MTIHSAALTPALKTAKLLIDGAFVESKTTSWRDVVNPATQELIGRVPRATAKEVGAAVVAAAAFQDWRKIKEFAMQMPPTLFRTYLPEGPMHILALVQQMTELIDA